MSVTCNRHKPSAPHEQITTLTHPCRVGRRGELVPHRRSLAGSFVSGGSLGKGVPAPFPWGLLPEFRPTDRFDHLRVKGLKLNDPLGP